MSCALSLICIDTTMAVDHWWDEQAEQREEIERWLEDRLDARCLAALEKQRGISF